MTPDRDAAGADLDQLVALLAESRRILAFTGAGISTGSGIPDYRGPDGIWTRRVPVLFHEFLASEEKRVAHWQAKLEGHAMFRDARPNAAHRALVALERHGRLLAIVTQNIDGLHQVAGSSEDRVVELHGTARRILCLSCEASFDPDPVMEGFARTRVAPRCTCGGLLKSATISFGQPLRPEVLGRALELAEGADLVLALGSTLSVHPAATVPLRCAELGAPYVIINRGATAHDALATLRLDGDVAEILPAAMARVLA